MTTMDGREEVIRVVVGSHMRTLADIEAEVIAIAIARYGGRGRGDVVRGGMRRVARELGIGASTLYRKLAAQREGPDA